MTYEEILSRAASKMDRAMVHFKSENPTPVSNRTMPRPAGVLVPAVKLSRLVKKWRRRADKNELNIYAAGSESQLRSCAEDLERLLKGHGGPKA